MVSVVLEVFADLTKTKYILFMTCVCNFFILLGYVHFCCKNSEHINTINHKENFLLIKKLKSKT